MTHKLFLLMLAVCALIMMAQAKTYQTTCPCPSIQGPSSICPNTPQNVAVLNAPTGSTVTFSVPSGSSGNIVSQSGVTAVVNQPGSYLATVCFPLTITIPTGTNCVNCPTSVTLTSVGSCPSLSLRATIANPSVGVTYTFNLLRSVAAGGPFIVVSSQTVGPFAVIPVGGISAVFSGLPAGAAFYRVNVVVAGCPIRVSNTLNLPACCQSVGAVLSSNQPGNPSSLTICTTPPGPSTIVLTCTASGAAPGATYRFFRNGVTVAESASNTLTVTFAQFSTITVADYSCQVVTQPGNCIGPLSNIITIQRCAGAGTCPTAVTLTSLGTCPTLSLRALIANPQVGVTYSFNLRRSTAVGGPYTVIAGQTLGPFATIPSGGIAAVFTGLPAGAAFYIVDVIVANCPTISSNTINLPACCQNVGATLSANLAGNPSSVTICTTPPGPSTVVLTCTAASASPGATYRFVRNGATVAESSSNILTVGLSDFTTIDLAEYYCQVITQPGDCVGPQSNVITIQRCAGNPCVTPLRPRLVSTTNMGRACVGLSTTLQCLPVACPNANPVCLSQFRFQLTRSSDGFLPGPTAQDFQASSLFTVTPLPGETFNCRVIRAQPCVGNAVSPFSLPVSAIICPIVAN